jgi:hypothetical protein
MPIAPAEAAERFAGPILDQIPRLLSQVDRNTHSPTYGCCCRNHWHYRIEDIPNSQMQEMMLTFALAWKLDVPYNPYHKMPDLLDWIEGILDFTGRIQRPSGCFDEVYHGQDSYAATAFVAFCMSETLLQLGGNLTPNARNDALAVLDRAAMWLARTREELAGNQVAGAAAAFMNLRHLDRSARYDGPFNALLDRLVSMQSEEGWFPEYGGADVGYASLTYSYLALIAHRTNDERARAMATKTGSFLQHFLHRDGTVGGEYGSRNTEYLIPLGAVIEAERNDAGARLYNFLVTHLEGEFHAIVTRCLDDRYLAYLSPHYLLAAQAVLENKPRPWLSLPSKGSTFFKESGLWSVESPTMKLVANLKKGGVFHLDLGDHSHIDCGYFGDIPDGQVVTTQHLDPGAEVQVEGNTARLSARICVNRPVRVTPWKNILVRAFNLIVPALLRRHFLDFLRNRAVSSGHSVGVVHRQIEVEEGGIVVTDFIEVTEPVVHLVLQLSKERAFSFASTGFFQPQELETEADMVPVDVAEGKVVLKRRYTRDGMTVLPS